MQIPIYAHVKQTLDPLLGKRDGIEINYMKFLAFNGPYKLFRSLWVGPLGAHDADWWVLLSEAVKEQCPLELKKFLHDDPKGALADKSRS